MLYKFVADFAISQPPLLRHLSIVRDVHIVWKTTKYIHYTYGYFKSLVDKGQTAWEAVISNPKGVKAISSSANEEKRDAFGFLQIDHPAHQYKGGRASLAKLVEASKPEQRRPGKADPVIMKKGNQQGKFRYHFPLLGLTLWFHSYWIWTDTARVAESRPTIFS